MRIVIALEYMILGGVIEEFDLTNKTLQAMLRSQYSASVPHANIRTSSQREQSRTKWRINVNC